MPDVRFDDGSGPQRALYLTMVRARNGPYDALDGTYTFECLRCDHVSKVGGHSLPPLLRRPRPDHH